MNVVVSDQRPERLIADQRGEPAERGRLRAAHVRIEQAERAQIAERAEHQVHRVRQVVHEAERRERERRAGGARERRADVIGVRRQIDDHQRQEERLHGPAGEHLADRPPIGRTLPAQQPPAPAQIRVVDVAHAPVHPAEIERRGERDVRREHAHERPERLIERAVILGQQPVDERDARVDRCERREPQRHARDAERAQRAIREAGTRPQMDARDEQLVCADRRDDRRAREQAALGARQRGRAARRPQREKPRGDAGEADREWRRRTRWPFLRVRDGIESGLHVIPRVMTWTAGGRACGMVGPGRRAVRLACALLARHAAEQPADQVGHGREQVRRRRAARGRAARQAADHTRGGRGRRRAGGRSGRRGGDGAVHAGGQRADDIRDGREHGGEAGRGVAARRTRQAAEQAGDGGERVRRRAGLRRACVQARVGAERAAQRTGDAGDRCERVGGAARQQTADARDRVAELADDAADRLHHLVVRRARYLRAGRVQPIADGGQQIIDGCAEPGGGADRLRRAGNDVRDRVDDRADAGFELLDGRAREHVVQAGADLRDGAAERADRAAERRRDGRERRERAGADARHDAAERRDRVADVRDDAGGRRERRAERIRRRAERAEAGGCAVAERLDAVAERADGVAEVRRRRAVHARHRRAGDLVAGGGDDGARRGDQVAGLREDVAERGGGGAGRARRTGSA
nr:putative proline-rich mucin-like protein [Burkholderia pseudomallei]